MRVQVFSALMLMGLTVAAKAQNLPPHIVTVNGQANVLAAPDYATITLGAVTQARTVQAAAQANSAMMTRIAAALTGAGIDANSMQTSEYSVTATHPRAANGDEEEDKITGYKVTNKLAVTVNDLTKLANVIDAATQAGANAANSVDFNLKDRAAMEDRARIAAVKDARHQAEILAGAEGAKIGKMISMTTIRSFDGPMAAMAPPPPFVAIRQSTPILPGEISISSEVTVQFIVE